ncbi:MAG: TonB family protein, partial [Bacteroidaceae bacterium]|nr:TonB family protein [Bacteroidaceae bacterium]
LKNIEDGAFASCKGLQTIELPQGLERIGHLAFAGCIGLQEIICPDSLESIGERAFMGCTGLKNVKLPQMLSGINIGAFIGCTSLAAIHIPEGCGTINDYAFRGCTALTTITGGTSLDDLHANAFEDCVSLDAECLARLQGIAEKNAANSSTPVITEEQTVQNPEFPGDLAQWLSENIRYPRVCKENKIQGRVSVHFIVNTDGSLSDIKVLSGPDSDLTQEALRLVNAMPKWKAGMRGGVPVKMRYVLPIMFQL